MKVFIWDGGGRRLVRSTNIRFTGTREEAEAKAQSYIGKVASWNATKWPATPNTNDRYETQQVVPWETTPLTD